jgi:hypothetical protein
MVVLEPSKLASCNAETVVPQRVAILYRVSPLTTVTLVPQAEAAKAEGAAANIETTRATSKRN